MTTTITTTVVDTATVALDVPVAGSARTCAVLVTAPVGLTADDLLDLLAEVVCVGVDDLHDADVDGEWRVALDVVSAVYDRDGNPVPTMAEATVAAIGPGA